MSLWIRPVLLMGFCLMSFAVFCQAPVWKKTYAQPNGTPVSLITPEAQTLVLIFLAPECPLCISYAPTLRNLYQKYNTRGKVRFIGVFPGTRYTAQEQKSFLSENPLPFPCITDPDFALTRELKAGITPEVVVATTQGQLLYQGRIDNWAYALGKKRQKITSFDLQEVLEKRLAGLPLTYKKTVAIGCLIE
jgi:thiol-disulfide isomerase/thioredoxin